MSSLLKAVYYEDTIIILDFFEILKYSFWKYSNIFLEIFKYFFGNIQIFIGNIQIFFGNIQIFFCEIFKYFLKQFCGGKNWLFCGNVPIFSRNIQIHINILLVLTDKWDYIFELSKTKMRSTRNVEHTPTCGKTSQPVKIVNLVQLFKTNTNKGMNTCQSTHKSYREKCVYLGISKMGS